MANLWFTGTESSTIGRLSPMTGIISEFSTPTPAGGPTGITRGPDGNLWFTESYVHKIGRITPQGVITEFPIATANSNPKFITTGPDGNLWFTDQPFSATGSDLALWHNSRSQSEGLVYR